MGDISRNFSRYEFDCPCNCGLRNIDLRLMPIAEIIRHYEGDDPMTPNSGCRCLEHNELIQMNDDEKYVPFSSKSQHLPHNKYGTLDEEEGLCTAGDFPSKKPKKLFDFLDKLFPHIYGIGLYSWGVHIDTRRAKARWDRR